MHLGNPAALWLLLLIPLLLLIRQQQPSSRKVVASLRFWRDVAPQAPVRVSRRIRFDRRVLLQAAFLTALILALASPMAAWGSRSVAIVIDSSLSMSAGNAGSTRLDAAKAQAAALLDRLPRWTRVTLIAAETPPRVEGEFNAPDSALGSALARLQPSAAPADLEGAIRLGLEGGAVSRTYVFSDRTSNGAGALTSPRVEWTTVGAPAENAALTGLSARALDGDPGTIQLLAEAANFGSTLVKADVVFTRDRTTLARQPIEIPPGARASAVALAPREPGIVTAQLEWSDALQADNARLLFVQPPRAISVRFAGEDRLLRAAVSAHPDVVPADGETSDVVVCAGCSEEIPGASGLILVPPAVGAAASPAPLVTTNAAFATAISLDGLVVTPIAAANLADEAAIVARANGSPAIAAYERGPQRVVELRFDPATSPLSLTPAFPALVGAALDWLAAGTTNPSSIDAGTPLHWRVPATTSTATITAPDGTTLDVNVANGQLIFARTAAPGTYRVSLGGEDRQFVVNAASDAESNVADNGATSAGAGESENEQDVRALRTDVSALFLAIALAFLAADWHVAARAPQRRNGSRELFWSSS